MKKLLFYVFVAALTCASATAGLQEKCDANKALIEQRRIDILRRTINAESDCKSSCRNCGKCNEM